MILGFYDCISSTLVIARRHTVHPGIVTTHYMHLVNMHAVLMMPHGHHGSSFNINYII